MIASFSSFVQTSFRKFGEVYTLRIYKVFTNAGEGVEKRIPSYTVGGDAN